MTRVLPRPSDVAFSDAVKDRQQALGSRAAYQQMETERPWPTRITPDLAGFIDRQTSVFLGTASRSGQPYIQHRGGPAGFLSVVDERTIGFADLAGNRQYITLGNLSENRQAYLFLIDYAERRRVKIWGEARVVDDDPALLDRLRPEGGRGRAERAILFDVRTWDVNCPQHIPQRFDAQEVADLMAVKDARIAELERSVEALRTGRE